jgi:hypothetical protein
MINYHFEIDGLNKVQGNMARRSNLVKKAIDNIIKKSIFLVERHAKWLSPVKTGRMRASIGGGGYSGGSYSAGEGIEMHLEERYATIMPTVEYAKYVHRHVPFMTGGLYDALPEIKEVAKNEIANAVK